jgi:hypothetical protein
MLDISKSKVTIPAFNTTMHQQPVSAGLPKDLGNILGTANSFALTQS